jgi:chaperonin GroES
MVSFMSTEPRRIDLSIEPLDDYVVVQPADEETETRTGLIIPASDEAGCRSGIVTAAGAEVEGVAPGDKVLFPRDAGFDVRMAGGQVKIVRRRELIARVHD